MAAGLVFYTVFAIRQSRKESRYVEEEYAKQFGTEECKNLWHVIGQITFVIIGLTLLVIGSQWLVNGAKALALTLGLSELIIGLTIVAIGTGMPEIVTSITASIRGELDIAVGNVVGSNIYNILAVLGLTSILAPDGMSIPSSVLAFDIPVMIAVAVSCLPIFFLDFRIARWEGALFLGYYIAYTLYLILDATQHDALSTFSLVMVAFVIPITIITLTVLVVRHVRKNLRISET